MARQYKVIGLTDNKIRVEVETDEKPTTSFKETCTFDLKENIRADKVYESLDYHPGDKYELITPDKGGLDDQKYDSCKAFFNKVIESVNEAISLNENEVEAKENTDDEANKAEANEIAE